MHKTGMLVIFLFSLMLGSMSYASSVSSAETTISCGQAPFNLTEDKECDDHQPTIEFDVFYAEDESFWDSWVTDSPFYSSSFEGGSHYGFSLYAPEGIEELEHLSPEDVKRWIRQHGITMSFGIGELSTDKLRLRFDYRWQQETDSNFMLQMQIPLQ